MEFDNKKILEIQNIVSVTNFDYSLNLKQIVLHARNAEYNPKRFPAVIMRIKEPKSTALIFSSGKMVCTGTKSINDNKIAARKFGRIIQKLGFNIKFKNLKIQNIVGSSNFNFKINLEKFQIDNSKFSCYEPEIFPGLIYKILSPKVTILIFTSGKIVLTGAKEIFEIEETFDLIYNLLINYNKKY